MKVIFLDVDGVLNSDEFFDVNIDDSEIDEKKVKLLRIAIEETDAKIVVDSSFRYTRNFEKVERILFKNDIRFDKTPFINNRRGQEIKCYLEKNKNIEDYVLLDDDIFPDFDEEILAHLIKMDNTNTRGYGKGLQLKDVEKIIKRFGRVKSQEDEER